MDCSIFRITRCMLFPLRTTFSVNIYCKHTHASYESASYYNSSHDRYGDCGQNNNKQYYTGLTWTSLSAGCLFLYWYYKKCKSCESSHHTVTKLLAPLCCSINCQDINSTSNDCLVKSIDSNNHKCNKKNLTTEYNQCKVTPALRAAIKRSEKRLLIHKEEYGKCINYYHFIF